MVHVEKQNQGTHTQRACGGLTMVSDEDQNQGTHMQRACGDLTMVCGECDVLSQQS